MPGEHLWSEPECDATEEGAYGVSAFFLRRWMGRHPDGLRIDCRAVVAFARCRRINEPSEDWPEHRGFSVDPSPHQLLDFDVHHNLDSCLNGKVQQERRSRTPVRGVFRGQRREQGHGRERGSGRDEQESKVHLAKGVRSPSAVKG